MCTQQRHRGFTLIETLIVIVILGVLIGLTAAAVQQVRAAAARTECANHLRQIGLGLANYQSAHGCFPVGISLGDKEPLPYLSWLARTLPYVEQDVVWRQTEQAYRLEANDYLATPPHPCATVVSVFTCPADGRLRESAVTRYQYWVAHTSYLGVVGIRPSRRDGMLFQNSAIRPADVTDGLSNTLLVGERPPTADFWHGWWYAAYGADGQGSADFLLGVRQPSFDIDPLTAHCTGLGAFKPGRIDNPCDAYHFWSLHSGGGHFAFADGSVRFLSYKADAVLPALATRAGGEAVQAPE